MGVSTLRGYPASLQAVAPASARDSYQSRLATILAHTPSNAGWEHVLDATQGAHPIDVGAVLRRLGRRVPQPSAHGRPETKAQPELHALDDEWYFDSATATGIAHEYVGDRNSVLLGCPTVARECARTGTPRPLIDRSATVQERLTRWRTDTPLIQMDLRDSLPSSLHGRFDVTLFDAPWHRTDVLTWFGQAAQLCRWGGLVVFPIYRPLTKPLAAYEREEVLAYAEYFGRVTVEPGVARYTTPLFERLAMRAAGVAAPSAWRIADLVTVRVTRRETAAAAWMRGPETDDRWTTWVIGDQVIKVRERPTAPAHRPLSALPGTPGHVLPSVSRSHPLRRRVGLWTSRNRVAAVGDPAQVRMWLEHGGVPEAHATLLAELLAAAE